MAVTRRQFLNRGLLVSVGFAAAAFAPAILAFLWPFRSVGFGGKVKVDKTIPDIHAYITANKNAIPFDPNPPVNPSGMRFGSPAVTTRGFGEAEMREVAALITRVLENVADENVLAEVRRRVAGLTERFPLYSWKLTPAVAR